MGSFVHLHVHSQYSLLESTIKIPELVTKLKAYNQSACAITDHGNMFGAVDFYFAMKNAEIKPILGCEIFYTSSSRLYRGAGVKGKRSVISEEDLEASRNYRLVLLCQNEVGYHNLCEIVSRSYTEGFHFKPRADYELLTKYNEGLIALSAGLKSEISYHLSQQNSEKASGVIDYFRTTFKDRYYLEVQENGIPHQAQVNAFLKDASEKYSLPLVAGTDAHYLTKDQASAHEVLMCIGAGRNIDEARTVRLNTDEFWLKDEQTLEEQFSWAPEALANTKLIADQCGFNFKLKDDKGRQIYHLPQYDPTLWQDKEKPVPAHQAAQLELAKQNEKECYIDGKFSPEGFLKVLARKGLEEKLSRLNLTEEKRKEYEKRLEDELDMIVRTGFSGYFLIVSDFITYAKTEKIPVGPGRGSGAGSLVAYSIKITDVDPIEFNLLFERFINPERISMPDFDIDFCQDRRQEVIEYVNRKYGFTNVSQIITFGKLLAKGVIRDTGRVLNLPYAEVDPIAKLVPEEIGITLADAFEREPRLQELVDKDAKVKKLFEIAKSLEGLGRHASVHAAGVVITSRPLVEYCPLYSGKDGELVVQFDKDFAEKIGLIKFDFLGLKTLTVIDNAVKLVHEIDPNFEIEKINYKDPEVFKLISDGDTDGVFQLESSGMKDLCSRVEPSSLEDITAINALYRPGPLNSGMVDDYINRKHGKTEVVYELPQLEEILNETYGVIVYQEQVMRTARVLANYSLGEADLLRRAMGKKKPEEMAKQRDKFLKGCEDNKIDAEKAAKIFDLLAKFAEYGFNKSHSAAYGVLSYQTAYLKRYYTAQFMAALMATEMDDTDKMAHYIADSKKHQIEVLPPDVNSSKKTFSVVQIDGKSAIRFGLEAIKGVGGVAVDSILANRAEKGNFENFVDFCKRMANKKVNKKVLESMIAAGCFDLIESENRATLTESIESVVSYATKEQEIVELGQFSMFDQYQSQGLKLAQQTDHLFTKVSDWPESKKLQLEKELVGFYVSGHPMEKYWSVVKDFVHGDLTWVKEEFERKKSMPAPKEPVKKEPFQRGRWNDAMRVEVSSAALVSSFREIVTKKGTKMAFVEFEDAKTKIEAVCFPEAYEQNKLKIQESVEKNQPFIVLAQLNLEEETPKLFLRALESVEDLQKKKIQTVVFQLDPAKINSHQLAQLRAILIKHQGKCPSYLEYKGAVQGTKIASRMALPKELAVQPTTDFAKEVNTLFGSDVVRFF